MYRFAVRPWCPVWLARPAVSRPVVNEAAEVRARQLLLLPGRFMGGFLPTELAGRAGTQRTGGEALAARLVAASERETPGTSRRTSADGEHTIVVIMALTCGNAESA